MKNLEVTPFTPGQPGISMRSASWNRTVLITAAILAQAFGACSAQATILHNLTGLAHPATVYTFALPAGQELPINSIVQNQFTGITIVPGLYFDGNNGTGDGQCAYGTTSTTCLTNFVTSPAPLPSGQLYSFGQDVIPTFSINFATPQTAAAFSLAMGVGDVDTITASLKGVFVESQTGSSGLNGDFYGFTNESFDALTISTTGSDLVLINSLQVGTAVPESGTTAMMSLGLVALLAFSRSRRLRG